MKGIILFAFLMSIAHQIIECNSETNVDAEKLVMTEKVYAKLFRLRRKEKNQLLKILSDEHIYEKRYKLLEAGYNKLITVLSQTKHLLQTSKYDPMADKFPAEDKSLVEGISVTLENTCLFGEMILHHPDMSYLILQRSRAGLADGEWKPLLNWCLQFAKHFYGRIIDDSAQTLLTLFEQEINPEKRTPNYVNPYRKSKEQSGADSKPAAKPKKKLKKGPQMSQKNEL